MNVELPYFDMLLRRLEAGHPLYERAFGRHVHWGYWADPASAQATAEDYANAAEALSQQVYHAAQVADGQYILDAGCGFGGTIASLNEHLRNARLLGINIDERQLQRARRMVTALHGNRIAFQQGDACALPLQAQTLDRVLAVECIFHFPARRTFFDEVFRVLKPGGILALSDFVPQWWYAPIAWLGTRTPVMARVFGRCALATLPAYRRIARRSGFELILARDITGHTLPTYAFMQSLAGNAPAGRLDAAGRALRAMEWISRSGAMRYRILAFRKRAAP